MALLSVPFSFNPGTTIVSAQVNADLAAVVSWATGNIQNDNLGTMTGPVDWAVTTDVLAISINTSSKTGAIAAAGTGVLNTGVALLSITSSVGQTTGKSLADFTLSGGSSTIPVMTLDNAGTGDWIDGLRSGTKKFGISYSSGPQYQAVGSDVHQFLFAGAAGVNLVTTGVDITAAIDTITLGRVSVARDTSVLLLQSNTAILSDTHGGASTKFFGNDGAATSAGSIEFTAYGTGAGATANMHRFFTRASSGTVAEQLRISASGIQIGGTSGPVLSNASGALDSNAGLFYPAGTSFAGLGAFSSRSLAATTAGGSPSYPLVSSAAPSTHGLHMIRGRVKASDGSILNGEGFTSSKTGVGTYTVTFPANTFTAAPVVVLTAAGTNGQTAQYGAATLSATNLDVFTNDGFSTPGDNEFTFVAIGQRGQ